MISQATWDGVFNQSTLVTVGEWDAVFIPIRNKLLQATNRKVEVTMYRVSEANIDRGACLHSQEFDSIDSAEEYIEDVIRQNDIDTFGEEFCLDIDYEYTDSPEYRRFGIIQVLEEK